MPRALCKFHAMGRCTRHDCPFAHSRASSAAPGSVPKPCKFFAKGLCRDGRQCVYQHAAPAPLPTPAPVSLPVAAPAPAPEPPPAPEPETEPEAEPETEPEPDARRWDAPEVEWSLNADEEVYFFGVPGALDGAEPAPADTGRREWAALSAKLAEAAAPQPPPARAGPPACRFFAQGKCRRGLACRFTHDLCDVDPELELAAAERAASQDVECGICFERVLGTPAGRFGMLTGCAHPFCLGCIRAWRSVDEAEQSRETLRACPLCRTVTHFVVPLDRHVADPARKAAIVEAFRANVARIPCVHFDNGRGECPFGTSCLYAHVLPDGRAAPDRLLQTASGELEVAREVCLGDFLAPAKGRGGGRRR